MKGRMNRQLTQVVVLRTTQILASCALLLGAALAAQADPVISIGDPVTGDYYNEGSEVFPVQNITSGAGNDTGYAYNWNFWLAPQGELGAATINLQGSYDITGFNIQDTHNRGYYDRGTDGFSIAVSSDDVHFTTVLTGSFTQSQWENLTPVNFTLGTPVVGQYVEFNVLSLYGGNNSGGLDELDVLGGSSSVPDGGLTAALLGGALVGFQALRRKLPV
jgi:hypothetical protein